MSYTEDSKSPQFSFRRKQSLRNIEFVIHDILFFNYTYDTVIEFDTDIEKIEKGRFMQSVLREGNFLLFISKREAT